MNTTVISMNSSDVAKAKLNSQDQGWAQGL